MSSGAKDRGGVPYRQVDIDAVTVLVRATPSAVVGMRDLEMERDGLVRPRLSLATGILCGV